MGNPRFPRAIAGASAVLLAGFAVIGFAMPASLAGAASWSLVVAAVLWGLGSLARRVLEIDLRAGEQLLIGSALWIALAGLLLAVGCASRGPLLAVAALGALAAVVELAHRLTARRPGGDRDERGARLVFWILLAIVLSLNLLAMVGTRGNPADDQAAYTAFVKRVLDCGNLIEPFSFRRLSAYGGQTMLHALVALRGDVATSDLLDLGIFPWIAVLLVIDLAARRKAHFAITVFVIVFLLSLWIPINNSGPTWTAFAGFLGAYAFASRDDLPARPRLILTFAVLGATCTLRQNFLLPAGLFGLFLLVPQVREAARSTGWKAAWLAERRTVLLALASVAVVVIPYMIAAVVSNGTPLYPIVMGTGNPAAPLRPSGATLLDELEFFLGILFAPEPIRVWWLLLPAMVVAKDARPLRPWRAYLVACGFGFILLVHSFMLSDPWDLWRYAFAFLTPLAIVFAIEAAACLPFAARPDRPTLAVPLAASFLVWVALTVNLVMTRTAAAKRFTRSLHNLRAAVAFGSGKFIPGERSYRDLQRSIPQGARVAVLLDDPWVLDYARNPIVNLDMPGFAAPAPGLPSFTSPEHWRSYFVGQGLRYLAFVDPSTATYMHRRVNWVARMYADDELYQFVSAHMLDTLDTFVQLAGRSRVLFHRDGMYVIDLGATAPPEADRGAPERRRMDAFMRRISEDELHSKAWQLASRSNVVFEADGLGPTEVVPKPVAADHPPRGPTTLFTLAAGVDIPPHRWLMERTRIRVHGEGHERVHAKLWVKPSRAATHPTVKLSIDGTPLASGAPDARGFVTFDASATCDGWCDLYIVFSSTFEWWKDPEVNGLAQLVELEWNDAP